jgi:Tfp pilus assembly protein PilF
VLKPLLEFYPEYLDTHINLGITYLNRSNFAKAEDALNTAISINPFDPQIHLALIALYEKRGEWDFVARAKKVLRIISNEVPQDENTSISN